MTWKLDLIRLLSVSLALGLIGSGIAEEKKEEQKITFDDHIKPIFREHCTACHSESDKASDLALDTYANTLAGGSSGDVIAEGDADGSRLFALVVHAERPFMPPDQDPIAKEQIQLLKTWIEQGMPENSGSKIKRKNNAAAAMLGDVSLGKPEGPPPMPATLLKQPALETARSGAIAAMAASPWAPLIAVGGQEQVCLYHSESGKLLGVLPFPEGEPQSLTFTRDGRQLLIGGGQHSKSGCAVLVDIASGERITKVGDELDIVLAADISPNKQRIAIAGPQKIVRIFDSVSGELVTEMKKHTDWIFSLRYSPDGILLATGDRSNGLIVWEAETGNLYAQLNGHKGAVRALDFRADSNVLASASLDGTVKLWDMFESKQIKTWNAHGGGVTAVNFANDGSIGTCGRDARAKIWDGNGAMKKEFTGLSESALEVALTGDAKHIAAGDWNGKIQLWTAADPAQTKLISANPPSIDKRLAQANDELAKVQASYNTLAQAADVALKNQQTENAKLQATQKSIQQFTTQLTTSQTEQQQLSQQLGGLNSKIKQLEQQLAAAKSEKTAVSQQLAAKDASIKQLAAQQQQAQQAMTNHQTNLKQLTEASQKATASRDAIASQLATAKQAAEEAARDKAALEEQARRIKELAAKATQQVQQLATQTTAAEKARTEQQSQTDAASEQMAKLQKQLEALQAQVDAAIAAQASATEQLQAKQKNAEQLKQQLEAAQQAALDAKDKLELFEQAYEKKDIK